MSIITSSIRNSNGTTYTITTDSPSDWASVANSTYFKNLSDGVIYYKTSTSNIVNTISSSYSLTASYTTTAESASYVLQAVSSSFATIAADATGISSAITNNANNNILTATGTGTINGEANLTFDSQTLTLTNGILTFAGSTQGRIQQSLSGYANGAFTHAQGLAVTAQGEYSHAEGSSTIAAGFGSHAEGSGSATSTQRLYGAKSNTITSGVFQLNGDVTAVFAPGNRLYYNSAAYPDNTTFIVNTSVFGGVTTTITLTNTGINDSNFAVGSLDYYTSWAGNLSSVSDGGHAEGFYTNAVADWSHAEGTNTQTFGRWSHAEGSSTQANGTFSHAEGRVTKTFGDYSHAEGENTQTKGNGSHAEGYLTISSGSHSHAEGNLAKAIGDYSHAEGDNTQAKGDYSHAEGQETISSGSYSHAEGYLTLAQGDRSHAEGQETKAIGSYSHAEGTSTISNGQASHAEGSTTTANGKYSHTEGVNTITGNPKGYYATMIASGVFTISSTYGDLSGLGLFDAGNLIGVDDLQYDNNYTYINLTAASCSFNGTNTLVHVTDTTFLTSTASIGGITNFASNTGDQYWGGDAAHAQGTSTTAQGAYSHAEGNSNAYGVGSHAEGGSQAYGAYSHAEGSGQTFGANSHAEGEATSAGYNAYRINAHITGGVISLEPIYGDQTATISAGGFAVIYDESGDLDTINGTLQNTYLFEVSSSAFTSSLTQITLVDNTVTTFSNFGRVRIGVYGTPNPPTADVPLGNSSHTEGNQSNTIGEYSHAAGYRVETLGWYQSVVGIGNKPIPDQGAFIVGDGDPNTSIQHNLLVAAAGSVVISGSLQVSGSLTISPTSSGTPAYTGKDGEIVFGQTGGNYKIYVWLGGAWRSGSLS